MRLFCKKQNNLGSALDSFAGNFHNPGKLMLQKKRAFAIISAYIARSGLPGQDEIGPMRL